MRYLRTLISTLLGGSLLHHVAISAPLGNVDSKTLNLEPGWNDTIGYSNTVDLHETGEFTKRQAGPLTWDQAIEIGKRNMAKLDEAEIGEDQECAEPILPYTDNYVGGGEDPKIGPPGRFLTRERKINHVGYFPLPLLNVMGIQKTNEMFNEKSIFSRVQKDSENRNNHRPVSQNGIMAKKGVIFALSNSRDEDGNPRERQLAPGEIMMQVWDELAGSDQDNLKWILRSHIVNPDTKNILDAAREGLGAAERNLVRVTRADNPEIFEALSGTPNCRGVYPTLATHDFGRLRDRRVTELVFWVEGSQNSFIAMKIDRL
ncbi:hypothetical protein BJX65DRAFT_310412 [Aspergillus insuetus]